MPDLALAAETSTSPEKYQSNTATARLMKLQQHSRDADASRVIVPLLIAAGFMLGLLIGRWWALTAAVGFGAWVTIVSEVEVPGWFLGLGYGAIGCVGIGTGIAARRAIQRLHHTA